MRIGKRRGAPTGLRRRSGLGETTLADVAATAGVSTATVSRALRLPGLVHADTRARIDEAVQALGYIPNAVAGNLATRSTRIVGVVVPRIGAQVTTEMVRGLSEVLNDQGCDVLLGNSEESVLTEERMVAAFLRRRPDVLVLANTSHTARTREMLRAAGRPVIEMGNFSAAPIEVQVGFDNVRAAYEMTRHLGKRGYRRIAFVGARVNNNERLEQRRVGYRRAMEDMELQAWRAPEIEAALSIRAGAEALGEVLRRRPDTEAIFFAVGLVACGAVLEAQRRGLKLPDGIAIAGFEADELGRELNPALTTIVAPRFAIGRAAGEAALVLMKGERLSRRRVELAFSIFAGGTA